MAMRQRRAVFCVEMSMIVWAGRERCVRGCARLIVAYMVPSRENNLKVESTFQDKLVDLETEDRYHLAIKGKNK